MLCVGRLLDCLVAKCVRVSECALWDSEWDVSKLLDDDVSVSLANSGDAWAIISTFVIATYAFSK